MSCCCIRRSCVDEIDESDDFVDDLVMERDWRTERDQSGWGLEAFKQMEGATQRRKICEKRIT